MPAKNTEASVVSRKLKVALFGIIDDPQAAREDARYGGVQVDTPDGPKVASLELTFRGGDRPTPLRRPGGALRENAEGILFIGALALALVIAFLAAAFTTEGTSERREAQELAIQTCVDDGGQWIQSKCYRPSR